jgi:hypothetical protein
MRLIHVPGVDPTASSTEWRWAAIHSSQHDARRYVRKGGGDLACLNAGPLGRIVLKSLNANLSFYPDESRLKLAILQVYASTLRSVFPTSRRLRLRSCRSSPEHRIQNAILYSPSSANGHNSHLLHSTFMSRTPISGNTFNRPHHPRGTPQGPCPSDTCQARRGGRLWLQHRGTVALHDQLIPEMRIRTLVRGDGHVRGDQVHTRRIHRRLQLSD